MGTFLIKMEKKWACSSSVSFVFWKAARSLASSPMWSATSYRSCVSSPNSSIFTLFTCQMSIAHVCVLLPPKDHPNCALNRAQDGLWQSDQTPQSTRSFAKHEEVWKCFPLETNLMNLKNEIGKGKGDSYVVWQSWRRAGTEYSGDKEPWASFDA